MEYLTSTGISTFGKWYKKLDRTLQAKVDARIQRIKLLDNLGDFKSLKGGVYELRFIMRSGIRIYFAKENDQIILLLAGGNKTSQEKDIIKAKRYWHDYKERGTQDGK